MKLKHFFLTLLSCSTLAMIGCDGGSAANNNGVAATDAMRAESFFPEDFSAGDQMFFSTSNNTAPIPVALLFDTGGTAVRGSSLYTYEKDGQHGFRIVRTSGLSPQLRMQQALDFVLTEDISGSVLGSRLRALIRRDAPIFTEGELIEIVNILNPQGANLRVSADGSFLIATVDEVRFGSVTSTIGELVRGTFGGTYEVNVNGTEVTFRRPTNAELNRYRFITTDSWIPVVSDIGIDPEVVEFGVFQTELVNSTQ